jgi:hypothetical protein
MRAVYASSEVGMKNSNSHNQFVVNSIRTEHTSEAIALKILT